MISIGLMSGTSMDGIDAAMLKTDGSPDLLIEMGHCSISYPPIFKILLKATEYSIRKFSGDLRELSAHYQESISEYLREELGLSEEMLRSKLREITAFLDLPKNSPISMDATIDQLTHWHAIAVKELLKKTNHRAEEIDVVGFHGQCMFHAPTRKISIILGDGQALADAVNITVVNDFRSKDIEAGGLGAPFAPFYHQALALRDQKIPLAVVNCGGIANITLIHGPSETDLLAYDTGPGNGLIDRLIRQRTAGTENMDFNGRYGLKGKIHENLLELLYQRSIIKEGENYFLSQPPKSLDIGDMELIPELATLSIEDACATLEAFTARTIIQSLDLCEMAVPSRWILAGGGWNNPVIYRELRLGLENKIGKKLELNIADEVGWKSQALEAQIFAYLAVRSLNNKPLSTYRTTRVPVSISGGRAYLPQTGVSEAVKKALEHNRAIVM
jgi:anhydro-N-acetylmuramic acid kinase